MVVIKLQGGLGNQLYQWAFSKAFEEHNIDTYLDNSFYNNQIGVTPREFSLNKLPFIKYQLFSNKNCDKQIKIVRDDFQYKSFNYSSKFLYFFDGYWQNYRYFKNISHTIKNNLKPSKNFIDKNFIDNNSVSIHVRRTDYLKLQDYHPVLPLSYYTRALKKIGNYSKIYIFSDDIEWCKNNFNYNNCIFVENTNDIESLWLMSMCSNNIIANSSFSWWAAWLNSNPNKIVIAPTTWFGPAYADKKDNFENLPPEWIKLNVN